MNIPNVSLGMVHVGGEGQPSQSNHAQSAGSAQKDAPVQMQVQQSDAHHDVAKTKKAVDDLNARLEGSSMKVVLDPNTPANQLWLNVVDNVSGKVIEKIPPEGLRRFLETNNTNGLKIDLKY